MWKNPKTQPKNLSLHLPRKKQKQTTLGDFWGSSHAKEAGFSSMLTWKKAHHQCQSNTLKERHSCEFWTKLERDFLAQITQEMGMEKVPQTAPSPSVRAALGSSFYMKFSLTEKSLFFHSVGNLCSAHRLSKPQHSSEKHSATSGRKMDGKQILSSG